MVQWLGLCTSTTGVTGSITGQGTRISHASWHAPPPKKKSLIWKLVSIVQDANLETTRTNSLKLHL